MAYATTKGAIQNFTGGLAQLLAERGIRVNCVAPGPGWTPLIPSTMPPEKVKDFGSQVPMKRPGQPKELAPIYVMLATDEASYVSINAMIGMVTIAHQSSNPRCLCARENTLYQCGHGIAANRPAANQRAANTLRIASRIPTVTAADMSSLSPFADRSHSWMFMP